MPAIVCQPWCTDGRGHTHENSVEDQWCTSVAAEVITSLYPPVVYSSGDIRPAVARVFANKDVGIGAQVAIVDPDDRGMNLTPAEALALADQLRHMAWVALQKVRV
jgi:hypothetical protein